MSKEMGASAMEIASLVILAREAYDQKRSRESLSLIKKILKVDPENSDVLKLQAEIRADIDREVRDARSLLDESRRREDGDKYRKAAEIALLKVLTLDPEHAEARAIVNDMRGVPKEPAPAPKPVVEIDMPFTAGYRAVGDKQSSGGKFRIPFAVAAVIVIGLGILIFRPSRSTSTASAATIPAPRIASEAPPSPAPAAAPAETAPEPAEVKKASPAVVPAAPNAGEAAKADAKPAPAPAAPVAPAAPAGTGTLAVSSPTPADIYQGDKYLGSTPTTLELPAGSTTLEYRHDNLRTTATHIIKPNETTTALVTFEVIVQINAKPWAQVFIDGAQRQALGQTPLSDVRVPVGKVLIFENPKFPAKTYRVTGKDPAIQVVFP